MPADSFESPLTLAACGGHTELAALLVERGANMEEVNDEGYTPLMEAVREGHEDVVTLLIHRGMSSPLSMESRGHLLERIPPPQCVLSYFCLTVHECGTVTAIDHIVHIFSFPPVFSCNTSSNVDAIIWMLNYVEVGKKFDL